MAQSTQEKSEITIGEKEQETSRDVASLRSASPLAARINSLEQDVERMFEGLFSRSMFRPQRWDWSPLKFEERMPRVDVIEEDGEIRVVAELPGMKKEDLDVSLTNTTLTIKAVTSREEEEKKGEYSRREISRSYAARTVELPAAVDGKAVEAKFKDGLLELTLPKKEKTQRIKVEIS